MLYGETWKGWDCLQGCSPRQFTEINSFVLQPPGTAPPSNWGPWLPATPKFTKIPRLCFIGCHKATINLQCGGYTLDLNSGKTHWPLCSCTFSIIDLPLPYERTNIWGLTTAWQIGQESSKSVHFYLSCMQLLLVLFWYLVKQLRGTPIVLVAYRKTCYCSGK